VSLGEIEEVATEEGDGKRVRHIKTSGFDNADSSSRIQRKADNQVRANLRRWVREVDAFAKARGLHRMILAGTPEVTSELRSLLPAGFASSVIGVIELPTRAAAKQVLSAATAVAEKYERETELEKVNNVITSAAKNGKAVVGLDRTLKAINAGRVWELIYAGGLLSPGFECPKCAALFVSRATRCAYCGSRIQSVNDVIERAVEHALRKQAKIEVVTADASAALKSAGGIAAFLKTRTGTVAS
jgi:peptide subunit release factor 1 (eRF1)